MLTWFRDWWRGYSDADIDSVFAKWLEADDRPGAWFEVTAAELKAWNNFWRG